MDNITQRLMMGSAGAGGGLKNVAFLFGTVYSNPSSYVAKVISTDSSNLYEEIPYDFSALNNLSGGYVNECTISRDGKFLAIAKMNNNGTGLGIYKIGSTGLTEVYTDTLPNINNPYFEKLQFGLVSNSFVYVKATQVDRNIIYVSPDFLNSQSIAVTENVSSLSLGNNDLWLYAWSGSAGQLYTRSFLSQNFTTTPINMYSYLRNGPLAVNQNAIVTTVSQTIDLKTINISGQFPSATIIWNTLSHWLPTSKIKWHKYNNQLLYTWASTTVKIASYTGSSLNFKQDISSAETLSGVFILDDVGDSCIEVRKNPMYLQSYLRKYTFNDPNWTTSPSPTILNDFNVICADNI